MVTAIMYPDQFDIAGHYDVMEQLDRDVHDDTALAQSEVDLVIRLLGGKVPRSVLLPCFGTGRHISALLVAGVQRIVGVDLSLKCVAKANRLVGNDSRVELIVGNLAMWRTDQQFDAVVLLGNSFGDIIDTALLKHVTTGMVAPLRSGGTFVMDYIGEGYLDRCETNVTTTWDAMLNDEPVKDRRTPRFDQASGVMTIGVEVCDGQGQRRWQGAYQKRILGPGELVAHFVDQGVILQDMGGATTLNTAYYLGQEGELGMIARSHWWIGHKE